MTVREIFETMQSHGLTGSQVEFSQIWLGRSSHYYSYLVATQREPGLATLCGISWRLEQLEGSPTFRSSSLEKLRQAINADIERRAITDRQKRRCPTS